jgi:hypothetical protein
MPIHPPEVVFVTRMTDEQRAQLRARRVALAAEEDDRQLEERRQRWLR